MPAGRHRGVRYEQVTLYDGRTGRVVGHVRRPERRRKWAWWPLDRWDALLWAAALLMLAAAVWLVVGGGVP